MTAIAAFAFTSPTASPAAVRYFPNAVETG
jgi:hypothetical protein